MTTRPRELAADRHPLVLDRGREGRRQRTSRASASSGWSEELGHRLRGDGSTEHEGMIGIRQRTSSSDDTWQVDVPFPAPRRRREGEGDGKVRLLVLEGVERHRLRSDLRRDDLRRSSTSSRAPKSRRLQEQVDPTAPSTPRTGGQALRMSWRGLGVVVIGALVLARRDHRLRRRRKPIGAAVAVTAGQRKRRRPGRPRSVPTASSVRTAKTRQSASSTAFAAPRSATASARSATWLARSASAPRCRKVRIRTRYLPAPLPDAGAPRRTLEATAARTATTRATARRTPGGRGAARRRSTSPTEGIRRRTDPRRRRKRQARVQGTEERHVVRSQLLREHLHRSARGLRRRGSLYVRDRDVHRLRVPEQVRRLQDGLRRARRIVSRPTSAKARPGLQAASRDGVSCTRGISARPATIDGICCNTACDTSVTGGGSCSTPSKLGQCVCGAAPVAPVSSTTAMPMRMGTATSAERRRTATRSSPAQARLRRTSSRTTPTASTRSDRSAQRFIRTRPRWFTTATGCRRPALVRLQLLRRTGQRDERHLPLRRLLQLCVPAGLARHPSGVHREAPEGRALRRASKACTAVAATATTTRRSSRPSSTAERRATRSSVGRAPARPGTPRSRTISRSSSAATEHLVRLPLRLPLRRGAAALHCVAVELAAGAGTRSIV